MSVPPPTDDAATHELPDETTFDEEFWRDYAVEVVGYREEWVDELVDTGGVRALLKKLGSRIESP